MTPQLHADNHNTLAGWGLRRMFWKFDVRAVNSGHPKVRSPAFRILCSAIVSHHLLDRMAAILFAQMLVLSPMASSRSRIQTCAQSAQALFCKENKPFFKLAPGKSPVVVISGMHEVSTLGRHNAQHFQSIEHVHASLDPPVKLVR